MLIPKREVELPRPALVLLVGVAGSGKSTFARRHFAPSQVLSSDAFRAMVADDENDQSATADAFDLLHRAAAKRLRAHRLTIVDATNVQQYARAPLLRIAREYGVPAVAIVFDVPEAVCWERTLARPDRVIGRGVLRGQHRDLRRSLDQLGQEGLDAVYVLHGVEEAAATTISYRKDDGPGQPATGPSHPVAAPAQAATGPSHGAGGPGQAATGPGQAAAGTSATDGAATADG